MARRILTTVLAVLIVFSAIGFAQGRTESYLEHTDEMLEASAERFGDEAPEEAIELYNNAVTLQEEAWELYDDGNERAAFEQSQTARSILSRAVALLETRPGGGDIDEERLLALIERNQERIDELTPIVDESGRDELVEMLANAQELNNQAQEAYDDDNFEMAQRLASSAAEVISRVTRALSGGGSGGPDADRVLEFIEQTDDILADVVEAIGDDAPEEVLEIVEQANTLQEDAWEAYESGDFRTALNLSQRARQLAERIGRVGREIDPEMVSIKLDETDDFIDRVTGDIEDSGDEDAIAMLEEAVTVQADARAAFDDGNLEEALRMTMAAKRLAGRAAAMVGSDIPAEEVLEALNTTDEYLAEVTPAIEETDSEEAIEMIENATTIQGEAWDEYDAENFRPALEKTTMARNIARRALSISGASLDD